MCADRVGSPELRRSTLGSRPVVPRAASRLAWVWACFGAVGSQLGSCLARPGAVVSEGQHVRAWTTTCWPRVYCAPAVHDSCTQGRGFLRVCLGVGNSAFGACAPHGRAVWHVTGRRPAHGACPVKCQAGWPPGAASPSAPTGCLCLSGWVLQQKPEQGHERAGEAGPGEAGQGGGEGGAGRKVSSPEAGVLRETAERRDPVPLPSLQSGSGGGLAGRQAGQPRLGQRSQCQRESSGQAGSAPVIGP